MPHAVNEAELSCETRFEIRLLLEGQLVIDRDSKCAHAQPETKRKQESSKNIGTKAMFGADCLDPKIDRWSARFAKCERFALLRRTISAWYSSYVESCWPPFFRPSARWGIMLTSDENAFDTCEMR